MVDFVRSSSSFARLSSPVLGSMPCVRLVKLSFTERVGRSTVYIPAILVVAHCSPCRSTDARANAPASVDGMLVATSFGFQCEGVGIENM